VELSYTQEEIAEKEGITHQAVDEILQKMAELQEFAKSPAALHQVDFEIPFTNLKSEHISEEFIY
jgi:transcriptional regulator with XRE-family HTH domain